MTAKSNEKLWNLRQLLSNYPAFTEWGVRHLVRHRKIPIVKIGKRVLYDPLEIARWKDEKSIKEIK